MQFMTKSSVLTETLHVCNNNVVSEVSLALEMDNTLTWSLHIDSV
jgi:hypothetical protein